MSSDRGARAVAVVCMVLGALVAPGAGQAASPSASPSPAATCGPAPDHLAQAPVGVAWIGSFDGVFPSADGGPPMASWTVDEVLAGDPSLADGQLTYPQPACDALIDSHDETRYVVTTADPAHPVTGDSVMWRIDPAGATALVSAQAGWALDVYDLHTLDAVRALIASARMPATVASPPPSPCPLASLAPGPASPGPTSGGSTVGAAVAAVRDYQADVKSGRYEQAWARIARESQARWRSFDDWRTNGPAPGTISTLGTGHDALCPWLGSSGYRFDGADLTAAWLVEVGDGGMSDTVWLAAPVADGDWRLWLLR